MGVRPSSAAVRSDHAFQLFAHHLSVVSVCIDLLHRSLRFVRETDVLHPLRRYAPSASRNPQAVVLEWLAALDSSLFSAVGEQLPFLCFLALVCISCAFGRHFRMASHWGVGKTAQDELSGNLRAVCFGHTKDGFFVDATSLPCFDSHCRCIFTEQNCSSK